MSSKNNFYMIIIGLIIIVFSYMLSLYLNNFILTLIGCAILWIVILILIINSRASKEILIKTEKMPKASDDLFIIFYLLGWVVYSLPLSFNPFSNSRANFDWYIYFSIVAIAYIVFIKLNHVITKLKEINSTADLHKLSLFNLGNKRDYLLIVFYGLVGFATAYFIGFFMEFLEYPTAQITQKNEIMLFMAFVSIPVEEIVFRGLLLDIMLIFVSEILFDIKQVKREERHKKTKLNNEINKMAYVSAIIISSLSFAMYHLPRYGFVPPIIYLFILGVIMGIGRYYGGLMVSYLIHLFNNMYATYFTAGIYSFIYSNINISIIYVLIPIILLLNYRMLKYLRNRLIIRERIK